MQRMQVKALSGGERNRLLLAKLFLEGANVLVLDEPTNDLDLVTLNVLERLLLDFDGSVLLVTHDRYFLDKVATAILAFEGDGRAVRYPGNYETYRTLKEQAERAPPRRRRRRRAPRGRGAGVEARRRAARRARARKPGKLSFKEQRELDGMEAAILAAEERKAALEAALVGPGHLPEGRRRGGRAARRARGGRPARSSGSTRGGRSSRRSGVGGDHRASPRRHEVSSATSGSPPPVPSRDSRPVHRVNSPA